MSEKDWNNWQWQLRNSFTSMEQLKRILFLSEDEMGSMAHSNAVDPLPMRITPYYASLMSPVDASHALRRTMVPVFDEFILAEGEASDPLSEEDSSPVSHIVHRYPDRVLFLVTGFCTAYCRYCTRSHMVAKNKCHVGTRAWEAGLNYIRNDENIRDVLISGGDPLSMPDSHIQYLLKKLREIPHVEMIRIGTKIPVVLPQRINKSLISILKKYHPLYMSLHFTHPDELTPEVQEACNRLADAGIPLGSQTVLLRGVNDDVEIMRRLMKGLLRFRVRPYYLYQCDPVPGSAHFRTAVSKGLEIIRGLRGHISGYAVPQFVVDAPGGGGKIPLLPDYVEKWSTGELLLRNFRGDVYSYPDIA
ncbi:MAG: KamA family radical SAM protein [Bacteroidota bacterium]|nr:KamA family radical SAM protein [Bacteroidota bacterium]